MCEKQEDFIHILEEIGEVEIKTSAQKVVDTAKTDEILIKQYRDLNNNEREKGSVLNFVSLPFNPIPEAGCGQSPQSCVNTGKNGNY